MRELCGLLADALAVHGYVVTPDAALEGRSGQVYTVPLLAERDEALLVDLLLEGTVGERAVRDLRAVLDDTGADRAVLGHLGEADESARAAAGDRVLLWGRADLVRILGDTRLAAATGAVPAPLPLEPVPDGPVLAETVSEMLPPAFQEAEAAAPGEGAVQGAEAELAIAADLFSGLEAAAQPPEAAAAPAEAPLIQPPAPRGAEPGFLELPGAAAPHGPRPPQFPLLPVRVTPEEARKRVQDRLFGVERTELVLQPVHLYDYECDLLREGSLRYETVDGRVEVHGTDKSVREVDPDEANPQGRTLLASTQGFDVNERVLRVGEERARALALEDILRRHTRAVEVKTPEPDKGFHYFERRKVAPRPDHVRLTHIGVHHRVVWRMWGSNGEADVDALDGRLLSESLRNANPDVMMLD